MKAHPIVPPLYVWGFVVGGFLAIFGVLVVFAPNLRMHVFNCYAGPYLEEGKGASEDFVVVAIGSSMTHRAIDASAPFWKKVNEGAERLIVMKRMNLQNGSERMLFGNTDFVDALHAAQPDCILVEENLIGYHMRGVEAVGWLKSRYWKAAFKEWLKHFVRRDRDPRRYFDGRWLDPFEEGSATEAEVKGMVLLREGRAVKTREDNPHFNRFLEQAHALGIKVVVMNIPRPAPLEAAVHSGEKEIQFRALLDGYAADYGLIYWRFPSPVDASAYRDYSHMNGRGMKLVSEWLADRLRGLEGE